MPIELLEVASGRVAKGVRLAFHEHRMGHRDDGSHAGAARLGHAPVEPRVELFQRGGLELHLGRTQLNLRRLLQRVDLGFQIGALAEVDLPAPRMGAHVLVKACVCVGQQTVGLERAKARVQIFAACSEIAGAGSRNERLPVVEGEAGQHAHGLAQRARLRVGVEQIAFPLDVGDALARAVPAVILVVDVGDRVVVVHRKQAIGLRVVREAGLWRQP